MVMHLFPKIQHQKCYIRKHNDSKILKNLHISIIKTSFPLFSFYFPYILVDTTPRAITHFFDGKSKMSLILFAIKNDSQSSHANLYLPLTFTQTKTILCLNNPHFLSSFGKKIIPHEILMNRKSRFTISVVLLHQISILNR